MKKINEMIVALYRREQKNMQYSEGKTRLFIAKIVFCILMWMWILFVTILIERAFNSLDIIHNLPKGKLFAALIALILYFILDHFTWKLKEVDSYSADEENDENIKKAKRLFFTLFIISFIALMAFAKYHQTHPILN